MTRDPASFCMPALAAALIALSGGNAQAADPPRHLFVFGSSLGDTGRFAELSKRDFPPAPSWKHRFSNGPVFTERLAALMSIEPEFFHNFSVGGAYSGRKNNGSEAVGLPLPGGLDQVDEYLALGVRPTCRDIALFILGVNDYYRVFLDNKEHLPDIPEAKLEAAAQEVLSNHRAALTKLLDSGIRNVVIQKLADIGARTGDMLIAPAGARLAELHNRNISTLVSELEARYPARIFVSRAFSLSNEELAKAGITTFATPCKYDTACLNGGEAVQAAYFLWDEVHPTTAVHAAIARTFHDEISAWPSQCPEPRSVDTQPGP